MRERNPWLILSFLCIPVFIGSVDLTVVSAILPEVIVSLGLPVDSRLDDAFWMVTGYLLAYTISMVFTGRLSDIVGRRYVYFACLLLFMFGSYWVAVAHTFPAETYLRIYREINPDSRPPSEELRTLHMIIMGRVMQALGAGAMAPVTMALVADLFPKGKRARPIALVGATDTVGWMLGHLYGGAMVKFFGANGAEIVDAFATIGLTITEPTWKTLFWFNIITGAFTLVAVWVSLRGVPQSRVREPFDVLGTGLIVITLIGLNLGLGTANPEAPSDASAFQAAAEQSSGNFTAPLLILAAIAFALFLLWELRAKFPLFDLRLFRQRTVAAASFTNVAVGFCLTIGLVVIPILVNIREGSTEMEGLQDAALIAGILLSALTVPMALAAIPGAWLSDRFGYRKAVVGAMLLSTAGFAIAGLTWQDDMSWWLIGGQMTLIGLGLGITISPVAAAVINAAHITGRGAASAMVLALRLVGMTLALSSLTDFAINRVNRLVGERSIGLLDTSNLYLETSFDVAKEIMLLGAAVSLVAALVSLSMRGGRVSESVSDR